MEENKTNLESQTSQIEDEKSFEGEIKGFELEQQIAEQTIEHAEYVIEQEKNPEKKQKMKERLAKYARRIVGITSIAALGLMLNHVRIHNNDLEEIFDGEKTEYLHSDKETNTILEYLSGKNDLSYEYKEYLMKERLKNYSPEAQKYNLDTMSLEDILVVLLNKDGNSDLDQKRASELIDKLFAKPRALNEKQYEAMFDVLRDAGNPKISWNLGESVSRPHYNPLTHTIYISPVVFGANVSMLDNEFIAELAHSKQFSDKPVVSYLKSIKSGFNMLGKFIARKGEDSFYEIQKEEYHESGSLENEAHSEIAPKLKEKLTESINSDSLE